MYIFVHVLNFFTWSSNICTDIEFSKYSSNRVLIEFYKNLGNMKIELICLTCSCKFRPTEVSSTKQVLYKYSDIKKRRKKRLTREKEKWINKTVLFLKRLRGQIGKYIMCIKKTMISNQHSDMHSNIP